MKKNVVFWLVVFLGVLQVFPIYSMAGMKLNLMTDDGFPLTSNLPAIRSFFVDTNNNLTVILQDPLTFMNINPQINVLNVPGENVPSCTISSPWDGCVTAQAPASGTKTISFIVSTPTAGAVMSSGLSIVPAGATYTASGNAGTFSWTIDASHVGTYLAVFHACIGTSCISSSCIGASCPNSQPQSEVVVMINVLPPGYTLNVSAQGCAGSSVTKDPNKASYNLSPPETVTLTPNPGPGCSFTGWSGALSGSANPGSIVVSNNMTVTATFAQAQTYTVSVSVSSSGAGSAGGSISPPTTVSNIPQGGTATFYVTINPNYTASVSAGVLSAYTGNVTWTFSNVAQNITNAAITFTQQGLNTNCLTNYAAGMSRASVSIAAGATQCWAFSVPDGKPAMSIQVIGSTLDTNAQFKWQFPDGRTMPPFPPGASDGTTYSILGPGNSSIGLILRSLAAPASNISDPYIPSGTHIMTITGPLTGYMGVTF